MFLIREPSETDAARFAASQRNLPFTYAEVGATNATPPTGYTIDHNRIQLGAGEAIYGRAVEALKNWRHFDLGWVTITPRGVPVEVGATVAVKARAFGTWSLSATRIVYTIEEERRFGFAYGTLPDHVEKGEERFLVEWLADDTVWYDILAFSRPRHPLVRLSAPFARRLQRQFARDSLNQMKSVTTDNTDKIRI
ncbi:MAG TPA: DUF1990 domain-containing protein [Pyrinomonadaceae bacterium]|nr:DUF1990 domain-containing protein [Pyrinomonadaceae bacterium]